MVSKNRFKVVLAVVAVTIITGAAQGRVFDFQNEYLASYFRLSGSLSEVNDNAFAKAGGTDTAYRDKSNYNLGGEVGFSLSFKNQVTTSLGVEILQPKPLRGISGKNVSGEDRFKLTSEVIAFQPKATVEVNLIPATKSRLYFFAGAGVSNIIMNNQFVMTATGSSELGGVTDFTEKTKATAVSGHAGLGYEALMVDTTTVTFELGYRHLEVSQLEFKNDVTTIAQGPVVKGTTVLNGNASRREFDMSGIFVSLGFRFYIGFIR